MENNDILDRWTEAQVRLLKRKFNMWKTDSGLEKAGFFKLFPGLVSFPAHVQQSVFHQFSPSSVGAVSFRNFCVALARALIGNKDEKAEFVFKIFDLDCDGRLSQGEVSGLLDACAKMLRPLSLDLPVNIQLHMKRLYETSPQVTQEAFVDWAKRNLELSEFLSLFEIVPSPFSERAIIKDCQKAMEKQQHRQRVYLLSAKWWEVWKKYVSYDTGPMVDTVEESLGEFASIRPANRQHTIMVGDKPVEIDNSALVEPANKLVLRKGLRAKQDYVILSEDAWAELYSWYGGGPEIGRMATKQDGQLKAELFPLLAKVYLADTMGKLRRDSSKSMLISDTSSGQEVTALVQQCFALPHELPIRFWLRCGPEWSLLQMQDSPFRKFGPDAQIELLVERPTIEAGVVEWPKDKAGLEQEKDWKDFQVGDKVQIQRAPSLWTEAVVMEVGNIDVLVRLTRENNRLERVARKSEDMAPLGSKTPSLVPMHSRDLEGAVGLMNLGNTCYINCIVQCLANTPLLKDLFRTQTQYQYINTTNPHGTKGKMAEELGSLVKSMWEGRQTVFNPMAFFSTVKKLFSQFDGHEQHDCHEFLSIVLDSLHEDLNRLQEGGANRILSLKNPTPEEETSSANQQWKELQGSKGSVISDLCSGQTRTTLICNGCQARTVLFETYMYLSLPLPISTEMPLYLTAVPPDGPVRKFGIVMSKQALLEDLVDKVVELASMQKEKILLAEVYMSKIYASHDVGPKEPICKLGIKPKTELLAFEVHWSIEHAEVDGKKTLPPASIPSDLAGVEPGMQVDILNEKEGWTTAIVEATKPTRSRMELQVSYELEGEERNEWISISSGRLAPFRSHSRPGRDEVFMLPIVNRCLNRESGKMEAIGIPLIISIGNWYTYADLHHYLQRLLRRFVIPSRMRRKVSLKALSNGARIPSMGELKAELPYTVKILDPNGFHCADCGMKCTGCLLPAKKISLVTSFSKRVMLGIDWMDNAYNFDVPLHPSVTQTQQEEERLGQALDLTDCFRAFTKEEKVESQCENCKTASMSMKLEIWRAPDILILNLKRFSFQAGLSEKIDQLIHYPVYALDISEFVRSVKPSNGLTLSTTMLQSAYDLYAVVNHAGSMEGEAEPEDKWLLFDDDHIMQVNEDVPNVVVNKNAYLLFYKRRKMAASNVINLAYQA